MRSSKNPKDNQIRHKAKNGDDEEDALKHGKFPGESAEMKRLDFYQTQPRSEKYTFYRSLLCLVRYYCRSLGFGAPLVKQLFYSIRLAYLDRVESDFALVTKTETAEKVLIDVACSQAFRAAEKCQVMGTIRRTEVVTMLQMWRKFAATKDAKEEKTGFVIPRTTPFTHFHGFGFVGDSRDVPLLICMEVIDTAS